LARLETEKLVNNYEDLFVRDEADAAALIVCGHRLSHVDRDDLGTRFVFMPNRDLPNDYVRFRAYRLPVDARTFANTLATLRDTLATLEGCVK
jgi:hypothetical protein